MRITQHAFAPTDLGCRIVGRDRTLRVSAARHGWSVDGGDPLSGSALVLRGPGAVSLHVFASGFAIVELVHQPLELASWSDFSALAQLAERRARHAEMRELRSPDLRSLRALLIDLRTALRARGNADVARPLDEREGHLVPYVMSMYFFDGSGPLDALPEGARHQLYVALHPSDFLTEELVPRAGPRSEATEILKDADPAAGTSALFSWSVHMVLEPGDDSTRRHYAAFETRVQHAWFAAYSVDFFARDLLSSLERRRHARQRIENTYWELLLLKDEASSILPGEIAGSLLDTSRYLRLFARMCAASQLREAWTTARARLDAIREYTGVVAERRGAALRGWIEWLLFAIFLLGLVPVVAHVPITSVDQLVEDAPRIAVLVVLLGVGTVIRIRARM